MNFFEEGKRLKGIFDDLVKQHKKSKRRIVDNKNVSREMLGAYEENRMKLMHFFEMHSRFIRPRKNSVGIFSVDDFVKTKTRESAMFSEGGGLGAEGRAEILGPRERPCHWGGMSDVGCGAVYGVNYREFPGMLHMQGRVSGGRWGITEHGRFMWMGLGSMGYPSMGMQRSVGWDWRPVNFLGQSRNANGFFGAWPYGMEVKSKDFGEGCGMYGIHMNQGLRARGQEMMGLGIMAGGVYGIHDGRSKRRLVDRYGVPGDEVQFRTGGKRVLSPNIGFLHGMERYEASEMPPPTEWAGSNGLHVLPGRREEVLRPIFRCPSPESYRGEPSHLDYRNGMALNAQGRGRFPGTCSIYPENPGKRWCSTGYPQGLVHKGGKMSWALVDRDMENTLCSAPDGGSASEGRDKGHLSCRDDLWRLDITPNLEEEQHGGVSEKEKEENEKTSPAGSRSNGRDEPSNEFSCVGYEVDPDTKTIEDLVGDGNIDKEAKTFIYELCDGFVDHIIHMSCALAYHRQKDTVEVCDVKLALKTEVGIELPSDDVDPKDTPSEE
uniref:Transcription initiation factor TFIID subunit 12 domain-containing protein n=1 Tax=Encephalitozoon cuniculi TaxID=6035 RepID=M1K9Y5_ENCCN|nr:hypothetical protein ECU10_0930 [Encephalitozoon cuniculi]